MSIAISPEKCLKLYLLLILILLIMNSFGLAVKFYLPIDLPKIVKLFDFNAERNIPTLYSTINLITASLILFIHSVAHQKNNRSFAYWRWLAVIFLFLAIDEFVTLHEHLGPPVRSLLNTSGFLLYAWVIPYGIASIAFVLLYRRFLLRLPGSTRFLFIIAGLIFVTGAIGFELFGGKQADTHGTNTFLFAVLYTCEEFLEMTAIVIFIYALLSLYKNEFRTLIINFE